MARVKKKLVQSDAGNVGIQVRRESKIRTKTKGKEERENSGARKLKRVELKSFFRKCHHWHDARRKLTTTAYTVETCVLYSRKRTKKSEIIKAMRARNPVVPHLPTLSK